jgi:hypothetical protein
MHLMSPHSVIACLEENCVRAFARLGVGPYRFPIRERYLGFPLLPPRTFAKCAEVILDCPLDTQTPYLATSWLYCAKGVEQTHVCISPEAIVMTWWEST